jgi:NAD-dependent SIR2 family protein deacetylase
MSEKEHLIFIIGAGASVPLGIPSMKKFTEEAINSISTPTYLVGGHGIGHPLNQLKRQFKKYNEDAIWDLEKALQLVREARKLDSNVGINIFRDKFYLKGYKPRKLFDERVSNISGIFHKAEKGLLSFIREKCGNPDIKKARKLYGGIFELSDRYILDIFTTNYDSAIETACYKLGFEYSDGFRYDHKNSPYVWDIEHLGNKDINIYKFHGSVTWYQKDENIFNFPYDIVGEDIEELMIYPTEPKHISSPPFSHIHRKFEQLLFDSKVCVSIGHSYNDAYIKNLIIDRLKEGKFKMYLINGRYSKSLRNSLFGPTRMIKPITKSFEDLSVNRDLNL